MTSPLILEPSLIHVTIIKPPPFPHFLRPRKQSSSRFKSISFYFFSLVPKVPLNLCFGAPKVKCVSRGLPNTIYSPPPPPQSNNTTSPPHIPKQAAGDPIPEHQLLTSFTKKKCCHCLISSYELLKIQKQKTPAKSSFSFGLFLCRHGKISMASSPTE